MPLCHNCKKNAEVYSTFTADWYCKKCYKKIVYKRVMNYNRENDLIKVKEKIFVIGKNKEFALKFFEQLKRKIGISFVENEDEANKIMHTDCNEEIVYNLIKNLVNGKEIKFSPMKGKHIFPFAILPYEEMKNYGKLIGVKVKEVKLEDPIWEFIEEIEKIRPGACLSFFYLSQEISRLLE